MSGRQPVHVLYGGAHLFRPDIVSKCGRIALRAMEEHDFHLAGDQLERIREKLRREPVEAYCIACAIRCGKTDPCPTIRFPDAPS